MRIFIISRGYPTPQDPQWGCFEYDQALALKELGHEVVMLSIDTRVRFSRRKIGVSEYTLNGLHGYECFIRPSATYLGYIRRTISQSLQLQHIYNKAVNRFGQPDLIYSHYLLRSVLAVWIGKKYHIPVIGIEHWSALNRHPLSLEVKILGQYTYPKLNSIIAVSQTLSQRIKECFSVQNINVIHNMYGSEFYYSPIETDPVFRMVATGSLLYGKGFDLLIDALHNTHFDDPWELNIIGGGKEHTHLQAQINQLNLQDHIHLLGRQNKEFIANLLRQSDCFILPSRGENFSVAVLEALACGLPVIASICGGIRECIDDKNGLLFEVDDVQGLTHCLEHMAAHYREYDRAAIAADCDARFSPRVIAQQLTEIFEQTIANSKL